jgi:hypothetical protein
VTLGTHSLVSCRPQLTGAQHLANAGTPLEFVRFRSDNLPLASLIRLIPANASTLCSAPCRRWNPVGLCPENRSDGGTNSPFFRSTFGPDDMRARTPDHKSLPAIGDKAGGTSRSRSKADARPVSIPSNFSNFGVGQNRLCFHRIEILMICDFTRCNPTTHNRPSTVLTF